MREENDPFVANELVKVDRTVGCFCLEVGRDATQTQAVNGQHCFIGENSVKRVEVE